MRTLFVLAAFAALVSACKPECTTLGATRCDGEDAMVCDADQRWQTFLECSEIGADWTCAETDEGHSCVPRDLDGGAR